MTTQSNAALKEWSESARFWTKHAHTLHTIFAPVTTALIEESNIAPGQTVLDVAGGAGEPSLTIAEVVGPTGSITCTDAISEMVQAAQREAERRNLTNLNFCHCPADAVPFSNGKFDAVVSRLGAMFFPDPLAALREMLRVTKPDGKIALVVWDRSDANPFLNVITNALSRYVETPAADPDAPGAFRFAEYGKLKRVIAEAGATGIHEQVLKFRIEAPVSFEGFWELRSETSATLREKLLMLSDSELANLIDDVKEGSREFFAIGRMSFPAQMIIVGGQKPAGAD